MMNLLKREPGKTQNSIITNKVRDFFRTLFIYIQITDNIINILYRKGDIMLSVWNINRNIKNFEALKGNIKTDVLIIGGGIAGILCALMLDKENIDYVLAEQGRICDKTTANTTAKITYQQGLIYSKVLDEFDLETAQLFLFANREAFDMLCRLCNETACDFEYQDSYVYSRNNPKKLEKELTALDKIGYKAELSDCKALPIDTAGAVKFKNQAQFNPLAFIGEVSENLNIFENTKVLDIDGKTVLTDHGKITADNIIITTHFPFINSHGFYFLKMYQHRSYVIACENAADVEGMYVDDCKKGMSFRNYKNLLLIGGGGHRTGKQGGGWQELSDFACRKYPDSKEKYRWAAQDCMTLDGIPYIGRYSKNTPYLYTASGFNKWGMVNSMLSAMLLTDMIMDRKNQYEEIFSPSRTIMRPQLALNSIEAVTNLLTPTTKRCTHLGCALKWNKSEHTWDCPCHGSRFTENGEIIENPAMKELK